MFDRFKQQKPQPEEKHLEVKKTYILKRRLASPKSVRFENTQFTVSMRELEQRVKEIDDHAKNKKQVPLFQWKD